MTNTTERTANNGEIINARLTEYNGAYLVDILANGMVVIDKTFIVTKDEQTARGMAHIAATAYVFELNNPNFYGNAETETAATEAAAVLEDRFSG